MKMACTVQTVQLPLVVQNTVEWSVERECMRQACADLAAECVPSTCHPSFRHPQSSLQMFWFFHKDLQTNQVFLNVHFHRDFCFLLF